jgi:adenosine kinase
VLERAKVLYTTSFFITSNFEALLNVANYAAESNKPFGLNLSAGFLIQYNTNEVNKALQFADYVFGNEDEAQIYADVNKVEHTNLKDVAMHIAKSVKTNTARPRVVLITQGSLPVIVAQYQEGVIESITEVEIPAIPKEKLIDTNGAGDSFTGAFLASIALEKDVVSAVKAGIWLSGQVVQRSNCTFPEVNNYKE